jgi:hypothetical protein
MGMRRLHRHVQRVCLALASTALLGCTSMQSVTAPERAAAIAALEPGDRVDVLTPQGWRDKMVVVAVTDTALQLKTWDDEPATIDRADVWELRVPTPSKHKTAALAGAIAGAVLLGVILSDGWELEF